MIRVFPKNCKVRIIPLYGKMTVAQWYNSQTKKPIAVLNGSLYAFKDGKMLPAGIVFENGSRTPVNGAGNVLGVGYKAPLMAWEFARAYDAVWEQFISGYVLVQNREVEPVPTVFYGDDRNLHLNRHLRLAVGQMEDGSFAVIGSDTSCTLMDFKQHCVAQGVVNAINIDGGASRHFIVNNQTVYTSVRNPYNIIAIYPADYDYDYDEEKEDEPLKAICTKTTTVYTSRGNVELGRYVAKGDVCLIDREINSSLLIGIEYPTISGMRRAYIKSLEGFKPC